MKINAAGIELIKAHESLRLKSSLCPAGEWTIGYGHTENDVTEGQQIGKSVADELLRHDLEKIEEDVSRLLGVMPATENQFSALVCLAFAIGLGCFKTSTVLRLHKEGKHTEAATCFKLWNKANGIAQPRLSARRADEAALYSTE